MMQKFSERLTVTDLLEDVAWQPDEASLLPNLEPSTAEMLHRLCCGQLNHPPVVGSDRERRLRRRLVNLHKKANERLLERETNKGHSQRCGTIMGRFNQADGRTSYRRPPSLQPSGVPTIATASSTTLSSRSRLNPRPSSNQIKSSLAATVAN